MLPLDRVLVLGTVTLLPSLMASMTLLLSWCQGAAQIFPWLDATNRSAMPQETARDAAEMISALEHRAKTVSLLEESLMRNPKMMLA